MPLLAHLSICWITKPTYVHIEKEKNHCFLFHSICCLFQLHTNIHIYHYILWRCELKDLSGEQGDSRAQSCFAMAFLISLHTSFLRQAQSSPSFEALSPAATLVTQRFQDRWNLIVLKLLCGWRGNYLFCLGY